MSNWKSCSEGAVGPSQSRIDFTDSMNHWAGEGDVDSGVGRFRIGIAFKSGGPWDPGVSRGILALVVFILIASTGSFAGVEPLR
jgi:hypothetical protein